MVHCQASSVEPASFTVKGCLCCVGAAAPFSVSGVVLYGGAGTAAQLPDFQIDYMELSDTLLFFV